SSVIYFMRILKDTSGFKCHSVLLLIILSTKKTVYSTRILQRNSQATGHIFKYSVFIEHPARSIAFSLVYMLSKNMHRFQITFPRI
ncbi:hypothetical protein L9F63_002807, partial [Diploptera punctata]